MQVIIVGGGIGGLSLALSLHAANINEVEIYESVPILKELGVGINLLPHAVRELCEMDLGRELEEEAIPTSELALFSRHGQPIWTEPRGYDAGYRWPQYSISRGRLLGLLYNAVVHRLGSDRLHLGHHLKQIVSYNRKVEAEFINRHSGIFKVKAHSDVLVGADGIHSTVRRCLYPHEGPPQWNGITIWRGVAESSPFLSGRTMVMAGYMGCRVVAYPISRRHERHGRALINWVAEYKTCDQGSMPPQDWSHLVKIDELNKPFSNFTYDWLDFQSLFKDSNAIFKYPMCDREPLPSWSKGPGWDGNGVTLLGDAAHPMYPVGSNGASQAILDSRVLARELAMSSNVDKALDDYERKRREATSEIVLANRRAGPEQCMDIVQSRAPDGFDSIENIICPQELKDLSDNYKRLAGFDVDQLNCRPSLSVS